MVFDRCNIPTLRGLRHCDRKDAREYFEEFGASLRAIAKRFGPQAALNVEIPGLINGPERVHATSSVIEASGLINGSGQQHSSWVTAPTTGDCGNEPGDSAHKPDPGCPPRRNCGDDVLPFKSHGVSGFPIVGNGDFAMATLEVKPQVPEVTPYGVYWAAYDVANGFARLEVAELVSAKVGPEEQLLGQGMVGSVFLQTERLPVTWKSFTPSIPLTMTFGHPLPNTVHMRVWGMIWSAVKRN